MTYRFREIKVFTGIQVDSEISLKEISSDSVCLNTTLCSSGKSDMAMSDSSQTSVFMKSIPGEASLSSDNPVIYYDDTKRMKEEL